jgi:hypothetical protein
VAIAEFDQSHNDLDILLHRYVREGHVFYRELKRNREILDSYVGKVESVERSEFDSWNERERLAFLINAYNASALRQVVDAYPVKSVRETGNILTDALDRKTARLFGRRLSLNQIKEELIRPSFDDPRYHFALCPAARSSPNLRSEAYLPGRLNVQFDIAAREFLRDQYRNRFDVETRQVLLAEMFRQYVSDFSKPTGSVLNFIGNYLPRDQREMLNLEPKELNVQFIAFDWGLNE